MKKIICKVEYDTDNASVVKKHTVGAYGDPSGYEETLYVTEGGKYFVYTNGGAESEYPEEGIKRVSMDKAEEWLAAH